MASCSSSPSQGNFTFADAMAGFLHCAGLPFVDILSEHRIGSAFERRGGLFGRTYTTSIVLWAFLSQVLRDGKEASCQSAVARISEVAWVLGATSHRALGPGLLDSA
ncbi:hypothetical protein NHH03_17115 [Stieleria sp. TO1_6]|uniref:hypothetical protein n=1 Tax=Stieleria tagensis TaxID=2956795 RepID=UPI00209AC98F|nr:hypothetical protein [Stieleria tagensis]MCO8123470.1 hypothetical protein [Stieleria tagensis]